jgi:hypothetical protein
MNSKNKIFFMTMTALLISHFAWAGTESMPSMPKINPKQVITVHGNEDFDSQKGFGEQAPMVRMMNLMMVEGSGMEGMSMDMAMAENENKAPTKQDTNRSDVMSESPYEFNVIGNPKSPKVGTNIIEITILDMKNKKPAKGLKLKAQVFMTSMDMGTEEPKVKEMAPGKYQVKAAFAMNGPWAVRLIFQNGSEKVFNFKVDAKK